MSETDDLLDIDSQQERQEQDQKQNKADAEQAKSDLVWLMSTPPGRRFIYGVLVFAGVWRSSYTGAGSDDVIFREGGRNVGLKLLNDIRAHCPELETRMLEENRK